jgi:hypothetical protein
VGNVLKGRTAARKNQAARFEFQSPPAAADKRDDYAGSTLRNYLNLDRYFAVDELAVVYPILNAIFDPIPIIAEETDSFVRGRIG